MTLNFILKRLTYGILVLIAVVITITTIVSAAPIDAALMIFGQNANPEAIAAKRAELHLDDGLIKQVGSYLNDLSPIGKRKDGSWGLKYPNLRESYQSGRPVSAIMAEAIPQTAILALTAILLALLIGIPAGISAALHHGKWQDNLILSFTTLGISLPSYVVGILLAYIFGVWLTAFTGLDHAGSLMDYDDQGYPCMRWHHLILPTIALGLRPVASITQLTRAAMLDVLSQDYIRTARAKGLNERTVIYKHAFRNALSPVITATSGWFAALLTGAVFVEYVFDYKGLGATMIDHLLVFDLPVVLGISLFVALVFIVVNLLTDLMRRA